VEVWAQAEADRVHPIRSGQFLAHFEAPQRDEGREL